MSYPRFMSLEELVNEVLDESEEDQDVSDPDVPDPEDEEESSSSSDSDESIGNNTPGDPLYIAKDGTNWRSEPYPLGRLGKENVINLRPGYY